jgi:hypothetical protein
LRTQDWHALLALGTAGGEPCADGDTLASGVHLLWTIAPELGFPRDGYRVWRRSHRQPEWACYDFEAAFDQPPQGSVWTYLDVRMEASPGPVELMQNACGKLPGLYLPGERTLEVRWPQRGIAMRASGTSEPPLVELLGRTSRGLEVAARFRPRSGTAQSWAFTEWLDGVEGIRFTAVDLRLCALCQGLFNESEWELLTREPILLPVVPRGSANEARHIHAPARTRDEAAARLSDTLAPKVRRDLADAFAGDIRELAESHLRQGPDGLLPDQPSQSEGARTPPRLTLRTGAMLALSALDPDVSRMLGLYWHDPVESGRFDYRVVAGHGKVRFPGRDIRFDAVPAGPVSTPTLPLEGMTVAGTGGMERVEVASASGPRPALRVAAPRPGTVCGLRLAEPFPSITITVGTAVGTFTAWRDRLPVSVAPAVAGTVTLEHAPGIDAVTWEDGPQDLLAIELRPEAGFVGELVAYAWSLSPQGAPAVGKLSIDDLAADSESARLLADGSVDRDCGVVGLDWSGGERIDVASPVRAQVGRSDRGTGADPDPDGPFTLQTPDRPSLAFARPARRGGVWPGPEVPRRFVARGLAPGWSGWRVRAVDAFGRLGGWSAERVVEVRPEAPPPPPDGVRARLLDPADPHLSAADLARVDADGAGLFVEWTWTAERRMRAPQVEPTGEFRVYIRRGDPTRIEGRVVSVEDRTDRTRLVTDVEWSGPAGALVGERVRVGGSSLVVLAHGSGTRTWFDVERRPREARRVVAGPFTIAIARGPQPPIGEPVVWDERIHVEPVGPIATVATRVLSVAKQGGNAQVTLAERLPSSPAPLTGVLASRGLVFPVIEQSAGSSVVMVRAVTGTDGAPELPRVGDACTLWTGASYGVWLPGRVLTPGEQEAVALGLLAVATSDGDPGVADDPVWSQPGRGNLGGRAGREGPTSRIVTLRAPHRTAPASVTVPRPPEVDGDVPADRAEPADWYGRARYTLDFAPAPGATQYRVLRASTAALFERDRVLRQTKAAPYANGPFDDDGASEAWLAANHPTLTVADLTADLTTHPDPASVQAAWRGWSAWYYPKRLNKEVMDLADLDGNQEAFRPAHADTIPGPPYRDTLDGRGLGRFVYRVRSVDASGNLGDWSPTFPVVEVRDVTPPRTPSVITAAGYDRKAWLCWQRGPEPDLAGYRVWRGERAEDLVDIRRRAPVAEIAVPDTAAVSWADEPLDALRLYHYRIAALDRSGNVSEPTAVLGVRTTDALPPAPPIWERAEWVRLDGRGTAGAPDRSVPRVGPRSAIALRWLAAEPVASATVERRAQFERTWQPIATLTAPVDASDPTSEQARRYEYFDTTAAAALRNEYRIRLRKGVGSMNVDAIEARVEAAVS